MMPGAPSLQMRPKGAEASKCMPAGARFSSRTAQFLTIGLFGALQILH